MPSRPSSSFSLYTFWIVCVSFTIGYTLATLRIDQYTSTVGFEGTTTIQKCNDQDQTIVGDSNESDKNNVVSCQLGRFVQDWTDQALSTTSSEYKQQTIMDVSSSKEAVDMFLLAVNRMKLSSNQTQQTATNLYPSMIQQQQQQQQRLEEKEETKTSAGAATAFHCHESPFKMPTTATTGNLLPHYSKLDWKAMAIVNRSDFITTIDTGSPTQFHLYEKGNKKFAPNNNVLLLYGSERIIPQQQDGRSMLSAQDAIQNCLELNIIEYDPSVFNNFAHKCLAFVPGKASYSISRLVRNKTKFNTTTQSPQFDGKQPNPLEFVPRTANGPDPKKGRGYSLEWSLPPDDRQRTESRTFLLRYLQSLDRVLQELRPIVSKRAINNTIVVMAANAGQADLLINFACSCHKRGLDIRHVVVFAMDPSVRDLVGSLGMTSYYDKDLFDDIPSEQPKKFGDGTYRKIAVSKFIMVHLASLLGVDYIQQDIDVVWYKDPIKGFFLNKTLADPKWDMYFQDDASSRIVFSPIRGNGGFFFVRNNIKTNAVMEDFISSTDVMMRSGSHQQTLLQILVDHQSKYGLRVKTFDSVDTDYFPNGKNFRGKLAEEYIQQILEGDKDPYIVHMSWAYYKQEKVDKFQQLHEWYVHPKCSGDNFNVTATLASFTTTNSSGTGDAGGNATTVTSSWIGISNCCLKI